MNSTLITASETIDLVSEEKFDVNLFITYKYCKSVFLNTYEPVSIKYIPKVCNEENQKYHAIYNLSQIPSDYSLVLDGSGYNDKECISTEHFRAYSVSHVLKIRKIKKEGEGDGDGDDNSKPNKKGGLSPGVIAAIVIVVIVVVAAIIVVVFIVLRRKKNNNNSESENEGNAEDI